MSNFDEEIRVPTNEEKKEIYRQILLNVIHSGSIINESNFGKVINEDMVKKLSDDEFKAILNISIEISKYVFFRSDYFNDMIPERKRMIELLCEDNDFNRDNLFIFISAITDDMKECRKHSLTREKWEFHIRRVFQIFDGENPFRIYEEAENSCNVQEQQPKFKIIIGGKYDG